jgi:hypothetical protein
LAEQNKGDPILEIRVDFIISKEEHTDNVPKREGIQNAHNNAHGIPVLVIKDASITGSCM